MMTRSLNARILDAKVYLASATTRERDALNDAASAERLWKAACRHREEAQQYYMKLLEERRDSESI